MADTIFDQRCETTPTHIKGLIDNFLVKKVVKERPRNNDVLYIWDQVNIKAYPPNDMGEFIFSFYWRDYWGWFGDVRVLPRNNDFSHVEILLVTDNENYPQELIDGIRELSTSLSDLCVTASDLAKEKDKKRDLSLTSQDEPKYAFYKDGLTWYFKFEEEEGHFPDRIGFSHIHKLLLNPGKVIYGEQFYLELGILFKDINGDENKLVDIRQIEDVPWEDDPKKSHGFTTRVSREERQNIRNQEFFIDDELTIKHDSEYKKAILEYENDIARLQADGAPQEEIDRMKQFKKMIEIEVKEKRGEHNQFPNSWLRSKKSVAKAINSAKLLIKKSMPMLYQHLNGQINHLGGFVYIKPDNFEWTLFP